MTYRFTVPGNPIPKARARTVNGRTYTPETTEKHEEKVRLFARSAGVRITKSRKEKVRMNLHFFRDNERRCDWDNLGKLVSDALNNIAYQDDDQVVQCLVVKDVDKENPRTEVEIF